MSTVENNPQADSDTSTDEPVKVPHAGNHPDPSVVERPVEGAKEVVGDTPLQKAVDRSYISGEAPDTVDQGLHGTGLTEEERALIEAHRAKRTTELGHEDNKKTGLATKLGAGIATLALATGAFLGLSKDDDTAPEERGATPAATAPETTTAETTPDTAATTPERESTSEFEPVLMTASTPEELAEQYYQNLHAVFRDSLSFQEREELGLGIALSEEQALAARYLVGNQTGQLPDNIYNGAAELNQWRHDRIAAGLSVREWYASYELIDSEMDDSQAVLVVHQEESGAEGYMRLTFTRVSAFVEQTGVEDAEERVWIITKREILDNEVRFGQ